MKLSYYLSLMPEGEELVVWDKEFDMEVYFYGGKPKDEWDRMMNELTKLLTIKEILSNGVFVNLSNVIEKHIDELKKADLFEVCETEAIMEDIENIFSGKVSEKWFIRFVECLKK